MAERYEVYAADLNSVYLASWCEVFAAADVALWKLKTALAGRPWNDQEALHLARLTDQRQVAYNELVAWVNLCEADRLRVEAGDRR